MENTGSVLGAIAPSTYAETAKYGYPFLIQWKQSKTLLPDLALPILV